MTWNQRTTIDRTQRADFAVMAMSEAERLESIAVVMDEFAFDKLAFDIRLEASFYRDRAAQALESIAA